MGCVQSADSRSVCDEGYHGSVGAGNHEDPDVTPSGVLDSSQEHISDRHEQQTRDDVQRPFSGSV